MSAQPEALRLHLCPMRSTDLDRVLAIEARAYSFPWTRGNFIDSLSAGHLAQMLVDDQGRLVGYFVAMAGVDELHLLNLTVSPDHQRQGHACTLLDALERHGRDHRLPALWLEVRASNARARDVYRRRGFDEVSLRRGYYPAGHGAREDAVVMRLTVPLPAEGGAS